MVLVALSSSKFVWSVNSQKNRREKSECSIIFTVQPPNIPTELVRHLKFQVLHEKIEDFIIFEDQWRHNKEYALVNSPRVAILGICGGKDSERSDIKSAEQVY